jgi:hypothetical protein
MSTQIQITARTWQFATGRVEQDTMRRRFWDPEALARLADAAVFDVAPLIASSLSLCALGRDERAGPAFALERVPKATS